ncbi:hypothetical protein ASG25_20625 [Rhizobium sp. Leaf384]|uniref:hypothetical protein n=1 Tax=Rhizobium sp. Leaf384 TaxID=1736358 RepID=UPI0007139801|nr:hypothetical protein [Rhizobium sp. Leaf384]KQS75167.1 hypothetical protein ASG25_20625 [Rhizobium sp. Leaf384]
MAIDLDGSFYEGLIEGQASGGFAGSCPYKHDQPDLRLNWLEGFAAGRQNLAANANADKQSSVFQGAPAKLLTLPFFDGRVEAFASFEEVGGVWKSFRSRA